MSYKTIVVQVDNAASAAAVIGVAAELALREQAHLIGLAAVGCATEMFASTAFEVMLPAITDQLNSLREQGRGALAKFEAQVRALGVASFETRLVEDEIGLALVQQGRYCDVLVLGQTPLHPGATVVRDDIPEYVLLHSRKPVLIVPASGVPAALGASVAIGWNGSAEAERAIVSSIPLLQAAAQVSLVMVDVPGGAMDEGEQPGADMALYLARHGIRVEVLRWVAKGDPDQALLEAARHTGASLLVMGAYGRSRLREFIMGGATRTALAQIPLPLWMAH